MSLTEWGVRIVRRSGDKVMANAADGPFSADDN